MAGPEIRSRFTADVRNFKKGSDEVRREMKAQRRETILLRRELNDIRTPAQRFEQALGRIATRIRNLRTLRYGLRSFFGIVLGGAGFVTAGKKAGEYAATLIELSKGIGETTESAQLLQEAFRSDGIEGKKTIEIFRKLTRAAEDAARGNNKYAESLRMFGITDLDAFARLDARGKAEALSVGAQQQGLTQQQTLAALGGLRIRDARFAGIIGESGRIDSLFAGIDHLVRTSDSAARRLKDLDQEFGDAATNLRNFGTNIYAEIADPLRRTVDYINTKLEQNADDWTKAVGRMVRSSDIFGGVKGGLGAAGGYAAAAAGPALLSSLAGGRIATGIKSAVGRFGLFGGGFGALPMPGPVGAAQLALAGVTTLYVTAKYVRFKEELADREEAQADAAKLDLGELRTETNRMRGQLADIRGNMSRDVSEGGAVGEEWVRQLREANRLTVRIEEFRREYQQDAIATTKKYRDDFNERNRAEREAQAERDRIREEELRAASDWYRDFAKMHRSESEKLQADIIKADRDAFMKAIEYSQVAGYISGYGTIKREFLDTPNIGTLGTEGMSLVGGKIVGGPGQQQAMTLIRQLQADQERERAAYMLTGEYRRMASTVDAAESATQAFASELLRGGDAVDAFLNALTNSLAQSAVGGLFNNFREFLGITRRQPPIPVSGGRASGGPVSAGRLYRINEVGEEYFMPQVNGRVYPAGTPTGSGAGMPPVVFNFTGNTIDANTPEQAQAFINMAVEQALARFVELQGQHGPINSSLRGTY